MQCGQPFFNSINSLPAIFTSVLRTTFQYQMAVLYHWWRQTQIVGSFAVVIPWTNPAAIFVWFIPPGAPLTYFNDGGVRRIFWGLTFWPKGIFLGL